MIILTIHPIVTGLLIAAAALVALAAFGLWILNTPEPDNDDDNDFYYW